MFHPSPGGDRLNDVLHAAYGAACACGARAEARARIVFDFDSLTTETLPQAAERVAQEAKLRCGACGKEALPPVHVYLAYEFEDGSGTVAARRAGAGPLEYSYAEGGAAEALEALLASGERAGATWYPRLTNEACLSELGRVFSIRSRWLELLQAYRRRGAPVLEQMAPGYFAGIYSAETRPQYERLFPLQELEVPARSQRLASLHLNGLDTWDAEARKSVEAGSCREWLPGEVKRELAEGVMVAEVTADIGEILSSALRMAERLGLAASRAEQPRDEEAAEGEGPRWVIRLANANGFEASLRPEVVFVKAIYQARSIGDEVACQMLEAAEPLRRIDRVVAFLRERLPEGRTLSIGKDGLARVSSAEHPPQVFDLASIIYKFDLDDPEQGERLLRVALTGRQCDCGCYIGKKLKTRAWIDNASRSLAELSGGGAPTHRENGGLVEVYSYECEHDSRYSAEIGGGDAAEAERQFQLDAARHVWRVYAVSATLGEDEALPVLAAFGPNAASLALHGGFLRELTSQAGVALPASARVYAPVSGLIVLAPTSAERQDLEEFAHRLYTAVIAKHFPQFTGEELQFWGEQTLPPQGVGKVVVEGRNAS